MNTICMPFIAFDLLLCPSNRHHCPPFLFLQFLPSPISRLKNYGKDLDMMAYDSNERNVSILPKNFSNSSSFMDDLPDECRVVYLDRTLNVPYQHIFSVALPTITISRNDTTIGFKTPFVIIHVHSNSIGASCKKYPTPDLFLRLKDNAQMGQFVDCLSNHVRDYTSRELHIGQSMELDRIKIARARNLERWVSSRPAKSEQSSISQDWMVQIPGSSPGSVPSVKTSRCCCLYGGKKKMKRKCKIAVEGNLMKHTFYRGRMAHTSCLKVYIIKNTKIGFLQWTEEGGIGSCIGCCIHRQVTLSLKHVNMIVGGFPSNFTPEGSQCAPLSAEVVQALNDRGFCIFSDLHENPLVFETDSSGIRNDFVMRIVDAISNSSTATSSNDFIGSPATSLGSRSAAEMDRHSSSGDMQEFNEYMKDDGRAISELGASGFSMNALSDTDCPSSLAQSNISSVDIESDRR